MCHEFQQYLQAFVLGRIREPMRSRIAAHVNECASCARDLAELKAVAPFFRFTDPPERPPEFWKQFITDVQLRAEETDRMRAQASPVRKTSRWIIQHAWATGFAVVVSAAVTLWSAQTFWLPNGGQNLELAGAVEFYLDQHGEAVAGKVLVEAFPVHGTDESLHIVSAGGQPQ